MMGAKVVKKKRCLIQNIHSLIVNVALAIIWEIFCGQARVWLYKTLNQTSTYYEELNHRKKQISVLRNKADESHIKQTWPPSNTTKALKNVREL